MKGSSELRIKHLLFVNKPCGNPFRFQNIQKRPVNLIMKDYSTIPHLSKPLLPDQKAKCHEGGFSSSIMACGSCTQILLEHSFELPFVASSAHVPSGTGLEMWSQNRLHQCLDRIKVTSLHTPTTKFLAQILEKETLIP